MKRIAFCLLLALFLLGLLSATARGASHLWSHLHGGTSDQYGQAVVLDAGGNVIVAGTFWGSIDLGGGTLTSAGLTDVFLAKYNATGAHMWSRCFGDAGMQNTTAVAVAANGKVAFTGYFRGTVDFGGGALTSAGSSDVFLAVYDAAGTHLWSRRFGDVDSDQGKGVVFDPHLNLTLTGTYNGTIDFGGGALASAGVDAFMVSFDATGAHRWSRRFGDGDVQEPWSLACDPDGRVAVGGKFWGSVDFGGGARVSAGGADAFLAVFDSLGTHQWSRGFGDAADQFCHAVAMDAGGNTWMAGALDGSADFGGGVLAGAGGTDVFVARFDAAGTHIASARFGDAAAQTAWSITTDHAGNALVTGEFAGDIDFGGGVLPSAGGNDVFVVLLDGAAAHRWSTRFGDVNNDRGYGIFAREAGDFVLTGMARGTVDLGGGPLTGAGGADAFVASFAAVPTGVSRSGSHGQGIEVYPNPFNPRTTIRYDVPSAGMVRVSVYDARGAHVNTLVARDHAAGVYDVGWNGRAADGSAMGSGVYFVRVSHARGEESRKMVLLK
jgi:hypothetical protein